MIRLWHRTFVLCVVVAVLPALPLGRVSAGTLPYAPALARCYDAILDARFDAADSEIAQACGPAPPQACELLRATALWWRLLEASDQRDRAIEMYRRAARVRGAEASTRRAATQALDRLHAPQSSR